MLSESQWQAFVNTEMNVTFIRLVDCYNVSTGRYIYRVFFFCLTDTRRSYFQPALCRTPRAGEI
jgi:hypothetical protein